MARLIEELAAVCRERFLAEKILVVPSLAVGHQVTDRLAQSGIAWVNLRSETIRTLIDRVIGFDATEQGLTVLSRAQALSLVEEACDAVLTPASYFSALSGQPGLYRAVQGTLDDLRHARVHLDRVPAGDFEDPRKRGELDAILIRYQRLLDDRRCVDRAALLQMAIDKVRAGDFVPQRGTTWLIADGVEMTPAEEELLSLLAGDLLRVGVAQSPDWSGLTVGFVQAVGEENEVRSCFRTLLENRTTLDDSELVYTHASTYLPLIYELSQEYEIACTFAAGVAASFTRPGQTALGFLRWIGSDFDAPTLRRLAASGALTMRGVGAGHLTSNAFARTVRDAAIGWGRDRTLAQLERLLVEHQSSRRDEGEERKERAERRREQLSDSLVFATMALEDVPRPDADGNVAFPEVARAVARFTERFAFTGSEVDAIAKSALCGLLEELGAVGSSRATPAVCSERLSEAVRSLHVAASNPRPGHLHVAGIPTAGYARRSRTFVMGLDDGKFPGQSLQDPVLLDSERASINDAIAPLKLPLTAEQTGERLEGFRRLLARVAERGAEGEAGSLSLSYSSRNLLESREQFPGIAMLEVFRQVTGERQADYGALIEAAGRRRVAFVPASSPASEPEWWLSQRAASPEAIAAAAGQAYVWLADGVRAEEARASDAFTAYDGRIAPRPDVLDPRVTGEVMSCSRIEKLSGCPYHYFLHRVLGLAAEEEFERDPLQWLNAMEFGSMFHSVAEQFMNELGGGRPCDDHAADLRAVADRLLAEMRETVPPPNEAAFAQRRRELYAACEFFLRNEIEHCATVTPRYFEVPFGFDEESLCAIAGREPIEIATPNGPVRIRGRIDRVDEEDGGALQVWDYKTGSPYSVRQNGFLHRGTVVQHAIYARAIEQLTDRAGDRRSVSRSGYFFASAKGEGQRIEKSGDADALPTLLGHLFDMVAEGVFPHASEDACRFCDFREVCDVSAAAANARRKVANPENTEPGLQSWRAVQEIV